MTSRTAARASHPTPTPGPGRDRPRGVLVGTPTLVRHNLRQDRVRIPAWILALPALAFGTANAYVALYPSVADRQNLDVQFGTNKAIALVTGPVHGLSTPGGFTEWRLGGSLATLVALMALFLVVRHTRADEEKARSELVTAGQVGRLAPLAAALITSIGSCLLLGVVLATAMVAAGTPPTGSVAFGLASALCGVVFAALAAVTSQLSTYSRAASALAGTALGAAYVLRGLGDSADAVAWLSWLSPVGWAQQLRPYNGERWWVLGLSVALAVVLLAVAAGLQLRRDVGAGIIERSTGPAAAAARLRSTTALAWRQHRAAWVSWLLGGIVFSLLFGSLTDAVSQIATTSPQIQIILERMGGSKTIVQTFIGTAVGMIAMIVGFYVAQAFARVYDEEQSGRAEQLLATPVPRLRWLAGHVLAAYAGIGTIMLGCGLAVASSASLSTPDASFGKVLGSAAAQIPALWIIAGACLCAYAWLPRFGALVWIIVGVALAIAMFGGLLNAPDWLLRISPYTTAPAVTDGPFAWGTVALHLAIALVLLVVGAYGVRRRDVVSS
ncbi:ABC transporter permease [Cumulibacter manganitolerans]|uniref:ABC transporter permease n=1 Tax=Cumulibacter manganitolerans TaxID=1884992 RepID=UPI001295E578|nr:ABC transporter permease [Cumulibacter manganitolerans]